MKQFFTPLLLLIATLSVAVAVTEPEIDAESDIQRALMKLIQDRTEYPPVFISHNVDKITLADKLTTLTVELKSLTKLESRENLTYKEKFKGYISDSSTLTLNVDGKSLFETSLQKINGKNANKIFWIPLKTKTPNSNSTTYQQVTLGYLTEHFMNTYNVTEKDKRKIQFPKILIKLYASSIFMDVPQGKALDDPDNRIYRSR